MRLCSETDNAQSRLAVGRSSNVGRSIIDKSSMRLIRLMSGGLEETTLVGVTSDPAESENRPR